MSRLLSSSLTRRELSKGKKLSVEACLGISSFVLDAEPIEWLLHPHHRILVAANFFDPVTPEQIGKFEDGILRRERGFDLTNAVKHTNLAFDVGNRPHHRVA